MFVAREYLGIVLGEILGAGGYLAYGENDFPLGIVDVWILAFC